MNKLRTLLSAVCVALIVLGIALVGVGCLTGGSPNRILYNTDIADMTKFFTREQIETVVDLFFH